MLPSEAARLMEISLGKLANIRSQRVSSSLHKNLLVAKVLNQVRTIVTVDDNLDMHRDDHEKSALNVNCTNFSMDNSTSEHNSSSERCAVLVQNEEIVVESVDYAVRNECIQSSNFEIEPASALCSSVESNVVFVERDRVSSSMLVDSGSDKSGMCRGSKRRSDCEDDQVFKKRRSNHKQSPVTDSSWRAPLLSASDVEDEMSADLEYSDTSAGMSYGDTVMIETEQITSLVTVFNTSFKGLGHLEGSVDDQALSPRLPDSESNEQRFTNRNSGSSLRRGISLPDLCAKQADLLCQKFQKNPPVVALTV